MSRGRSLLWSNSEMLAHKKNAGHEALLHGDLHLLHRRKVMAICGLDVELKKVHTDLSQVRTSTGHSVVALPPTPFRLHRLHRGRRSITSLHTPQSRRQSPPHPQSLPQRPPLFRPLPPPKALKQPSRNDEGKRSVQLERDHSLSPTVSANPTSAVVPSPTTAIVPISTTTATVSSPIPPTVPKASVAVIPKPDSASRETHLPIPEDSPSPISFVVLPELNLARRPSLLKVTSKGNNHRRLSVEFSLPATVHDVTATIDPQELGSALLRVGGGGRRTSGQAESPPLTLSRDGTESGLGRLSASQGDDTDQIQLPSGDLDRTETRNSSSPVMPLSREISQMVQSLREKNRELLAVKAAVLTINKGKEESDDREFPDLDQRDSPCQDHDRLKLDLARAKKAASSVRLPNTRYQCRTCLERLRDNARYRRSLRRAGEGGGGAAGVGGSKSDPSQPRRGTAQKLARFPAKDLDGNVLDGQGNKQKKKSLQLSASPLTRGKREGTEVKDSAQKVKGKEEEGAKPSPAPNGFSRSRMERLAQPRGGPKPRLHVSGRVLRRQAESLRHSHQRSRLTEREQECVLMLQSRVRLFLALLQERQMPPSMVHIPQRDDIMHVDISHLG